MNSQKAMLNKRKNRIRSLIMAFILLGIGLFLMVDTIAFNPKYSIYNINSISDLNYHIFGIYGLSLASFIYRFIGYSSYALSIFLLYTGYLILLKKKKILIYLSIPFWIFEISLFSVIFTIGKGGLSIKGGLLGKYLIKNLFLDHYKLIKLIGILIAVISISLTMYKPVFRRLINYILKVLNRLKRHKSVEFENRVKRKKSFSFNKNKLPLIKKVYCYDGNVLGNDLLNNEIEKGIATKETYPTGDNIESVMEDGQYVLPVLSERGKNGQIRHTGLTHPKLNSSILKKSNFFNKKEQERETQKKAKELERTLREFGIEAKVTGIIRGPVITRYEIQPAPGVKLNRIVNLSDNIALNLSAKGVRIEAPIPGRSAVGIEVPNEYREIVMLGDVLEKADVKGELPLILGKDVSGKIVVSDLTEMPHLLIAGATGSGKSVCVNSLILSLLFERSPENVKFIMIDPKMVELKIYNGIPHLLTEVVTDPRQAAKALRWVIFEMENRYKRLDEYKVRDIKGYNQKVSTRMPYIVLIIDEFANLMAISQKDVEDAVVRLAAMSRAVGIHIIMATQRPSVDVITGLIKANFPYRIAFQVASKTDSRTILDTMGAEKLLGQGDMLFSPAGSMNLIRVQGAYVSEEEVISVVKELKKVGDVEYKDILDYEEKSSSFNNGSDDPMYDEAVDIVIKTRRASASFLQRRLKIGYNRAARLIEIMEEKGIIGPPRGSKPREIFIDKLD